MCGLSRRPVTRDRKQEGPWESRTIGRKGVVSCKQQNGFPMKGHGGVLYYMTLPLPIFRKLLALLLYI